MGLQYKLPYKTTTPGSQKLESKVCWEFLPEAPRSKSLVLKESNEKSMSICTRVLAIFSPHLLRCSYPTKTGVMPLCANAEFMRILTSK